MTTTTLGDLLTRADDLCRELRDSPKSVPRHAWESFDATAYQLMRELVGPARTSNRALVLSHAALSRVLDAYPAPLRGAPTGPVGAREAAHLLGRPRSAVIAKIRNGQIPAAWDGGQYLVNVTDLPSRDDVRPANPANPEPLSRLSCALGAAADLVVQDRDRPRADVRAGADSLDAVVAPVIAHVLGIVHVAASHTVRFGALSDIDRPLAVARYAATALDTLSDVGRGSPMLAAPSFAPPPNPTSLNERLESGIRCWVTSARAELDRTVPSTDVIRNIMNHGVHLYAVSARLLDAANFGSKRDPETSASNREHLHTAMKALSQADRLWGSVTTGMRPAHEYVVAARELHAVLTDTTHDGPHARTINQITEQLDIGQALTDLQYASNDLTSMVRDVQHLPDQLLRSGVLFAPASQLKPSVERLHDRAAGRYVSVLPEEAPTLVTAARAVPWDSEAATRALEHAINRTIPLTISATSHRQTASVPEL